MKTYKHLFFDMDLTLAPTRQLILPEMFDLVSSLSQDIIIASGQDVDKIDWQSNNLPAYRLGQNGNRAVDIEGNELWYTPLTEKQKAEINAHIEAILATLPEEPKEEWTPIEDRGAQITFSPIGNTAPVEVKVKYDPDKKKRLKILEDVPLESEEVSVKLGGSTSFDYIPKSRHKGTNVQKLIDHMGWENEDCVYFGDGLFPGGNDEVVIGVIDTIPVEDNFDTYEKLKEMFKK